jgi:WD40 repeat protein
VDLAEHRIVDRVDLGVHPSSLDLSPDGAQLAVGAATGEIGLADARTGEWLRAPTEAHASWVQRVAYSSDGTTVASAGNDGRIALWDRGTGDLLATVTPGPPNVWAAAEYLPDNHNLVVANRDGTVYTWDTKLEPWIAFACGVAGRNLTEAEWRDAFPDRGYHPTCPLD